LTGWPLAKAYPASTSEEVMQFIRSDIITPFGVPHKVLSENAQYLNAKALKDFADRAEIAWKYVSPCSAQANGKVERFEGNAEAFDFEIYNIREY
jgi:hypothetical protein